MPPDVRAVIGSAELGLPPGSWAELDSAIRPLPRERAALAVIGLLNLYSVFANEGQALSVSGMFANLLPLEHRKRLVPVLNGGQSVFIEPHQLLLVLKRVLSVCELTKSALPKNGMVCLFDACRFATDILNESPFPEPEQNDPDAWLKVAAGMMPRLSMLNPPHVGHAIARFQLMTDLRGTSDSKLSAHLAALDSRFPAMFDGLSFSEVTTIVRFIALWAIRGEVKEAGGNPQIVRLNPETFFRNTVFGRKKLDSFLNRTALNANSSSTFSRDKSVVLFRDRPLIRFSDGSIAPIFPAFLAEKLTADLFWWLKPLAGKQSRAWQADWGQIVETYVLRRLEAIAVSQLDWRQRVPLHPKGELDAALWHHREVILIEVTSSQLLESETISGDWQQLRAGLRRILIERPDGYKEAGAQLKRDIEALLAGGTDLPVSQAQRIYPVIVSAERNVRTPGVCRYLQTEFAASLTPAQASLCAPLAVLGLEDLDSLETLIKARPELGGRGKGMLEVLKAWDQIQGRSQAWWYFVEEKYGDLPANDDLKHGALLWRATVKQYMRKPSLWRVLWARGSAILVRTMAKIRTWLRSPRIN